MNEPIRFDEDSGAYVDCRVKRGFPLGGIGAGQICLNTDGSFGELRSNNNWMCPVRGLAGSFFALHAKSADETQTLLLRGAPAEDAPPDYAGAVNVESTTFAGMLPAFSLRFEHALPFGLTLDGFTPHVPHDVASSTLPAAIFRFRFENPGDGEITAAILFSFENVLGRGGSGSLGVELGPEGELTGVRARVVYDSVTGNFQEEANVGGRRGVRFRTEQTYDERDHRRSVTGEYLMLVEPAPGLEVTVCDGWNAGAEASTVLDEFAQDGRISSHDGGRRGEDGVYRPAAACAARMTLPPHGRRDIVFVLAWWTADHVTEPSLALRASGGRADVPHDGARVGHVYETHFASLDAAATYVLDERIALEERSTEVVRLLRDSTLPPWLIRALANSIDSTLCNSVVPASGRLYTLEGVDWNWPMGGLTGTNDQRLAAHGYVETFFPELNLTELDEFRRLHDARGAIPHGNGNCDLGLGTTDVPYGWPMFIKDFLPAKEWTDLTMSLVLQVGKIWRATGRGDVLERFWPDLVHGVEYLRSIAPHGVPEGGTTYDVWDFPGTFAYTATLWSATLAMMADMAEAIEPQRADVYRGIARDADAQLAILWDTRGFYRTTATHDTIFTAALAGDWIARAAGLPPVVPHARTVSHLEHQQRVLIDAAVTAAQGRYRALPRAEATFEGEEVVNAMGRGLPREETMTYVWQVLTYQVALQIQVGLVDAGLRTARMLDDRIWRDGNAWSAGLRGNDESIYMTHPAWWSVLQALTGAALDVPERTLHVAPRAGTDMPRLRCPIFLPGAWAVLTYDPDKLHGGIEVLRHFGTPVEIDTVVAHGPGGSTRVQKIDRTPLAAGARIAFDVDRGKKVK
ncbi:MAG: GH116 family glycosyl-hydrolase [Candidatus Binatia bacterium]